MRGPGLICRVWLGLMLLANLTIRPAAAVDLAIHNVPLEHILLDDFQGGAVPLPDASPEFLKQIKDLIPPLSSPRYVKAAEATWLKNGDLVLGFIEGDDARAYPIRILNFHEIVNETIGGRPVLISYCPLCRSGLVFDRRVNGRVLTFGNTGGLYESDLVMYDHQTDSFWFQVGGEAIVGSLTGTRLVLLPALLLPWEEWRALYPASLVLSHKTGFARPYDADPFVGYDEPGTPPGFPVRTSDRRLDPKAKVLGIEQKGARRAYSFTGLGDAVVMDTLGGQPLVIFSKRDGPAGAAFDPRVKSQPFTFALKGGKFTDAQTGSIWNLAGQAVAGPLAGARLTPLPARSTFWFAWVAAFPDSSLYASPPIAPAPP